MSPKTADQLKGFFYILAQTCHLLGTVIPPLLRLGLIDRTEGVVLEVIIGVVVALRSMRAKSEGLGDET